MIYKARAENRKMNVDLRNGCGSLTLTADTANEVACLTRIYRHFEGIEYSAIVAGLFAPLPAMALSADAIVRSRADRAVVWESRNER